MHIWVALFHPSHISEETLRTVAALVGAVATSLAVIIALYRETIREWRTRPKLELAFHPKKYGPLIADVGVASQPSVKVPSFWLRLQVTNGKGRRTASDVSVLVTEAQRLEGTTKIWAGLDTVPLIWSNLSQPTTSVDLPSGVGRFVDVAALRWPLGATGIPPEGSTGCWAEIQVLPWPSAERNHWQAGRYRIELAVTAKDTTARRYEVTFMLDGIWTPNTDQWAHFMLSGLKKLR